MDLPRNRGQRQVHWSLHSGRSVSLACSPPQRFHLKEIMEILLFMAVEVRDLFHSFSWTLECILWYMTLWACSKRRQPRSIEILADSLEVSRWSPNIVDSMKNRTVGQEHSKCSSNVPSLVLQSIAMSLGWLTESSLIPKELGSERFGTVSIFCRCHWCHLLS